MARLFAIVLFCAGIFCLAQSQAQVPMTGAGLGAPGGAAPSTTTWNPSDIAAGLTLTNGNLTVTQTTGGGEAAVRSIASHSTGKFYYEATGNGSGSFELVGFGDATMSLTNFVGGGSTSFGCNSGSLYTNGAPVASCPTAGPSDTVQIAVDFGTQKLWVNVNGGVGTWNTSFTIAQVAAGTGGISISTAGAGPFFAAVSTFGGLGGFTANFGGTAYAFTPPSGFGNW